MTGTAPPRPLYQRLRERLYEVLEVAAPGDTLSRLINLSIIALVVLNALALGLGFVPLLKPYARYFYWFEVFSVAFFSIEYLLRLWTCTCHSAYGRPVGGRLRFALRPLMLIDLLAILPFYLPFLLKFDLRLLRLLRLARLLRLFKLTRHMRQRPADQASVEEMLVQFQRDMARIRGEVSAGREQDLSSLLAEIDATTTTIRQTQQAWYLRRRRGEDDAQTWQETRTGLLAPIEELEGKLVDEERLHQTRALISTAYAQTAALFDQAPEWASVAVPLGWKNIQSFSRVPARGLGQHHFRGLAGHDEGAFARFRRTYVDELRRRFDGVRAAVKYVLGQAEKAPATGALPHEVQVGLNRAINRLRELGDPARSAWDGLLWELEEDQQERMQLVRTDVGRYATPLFYLGRLGRWLRSHILALGGRLRALFFQLLPLARQRLTEIYDYAFGHLKPLLQWIGLIKPQVMEVMQTLDEAQLQSVQQRGLPADYLDHFAFSPLDEDSLFVGFDEELATLDQAIQRWEDKLSTSFMIYGQRGGGKTTLLNVAQKRLFEEDQLVTRAVVDRKITTAAELVNYLSGLLDLGSVSSFDKLADTLMQGPRRAVLLEGCHNLYLRCIGGTEAFRHLLWLVARTNYHVLWGLCMDKYAHNYLSKSLPLGRLFHFHIGIEDWTPQELRQLVLLRHNQSGYSLRYAFDKSLEKALRRRIKYWRRPDEPAVQEALELIFFERLVETAGENIIVALYYWLRSLEPAGSDRYTVQPMRELDLDLVLNFSLDQAFILAAVLQHDNLTAADVARILDSSPLQTRLELEILDNQNILDADLESGSYRINPVALKPVTQMLVGRNLLY